MQKLAKYTTKILWLLLLISNCQTSYCQSKQKPDSNAQSASKSDQGAYQLYKQGNFADAADSFENLIKSTNPNASLYYYAALANMQCGKRARSNQLFKYIDTYFTASPEATYAHKALSQQLPTKNSQENSVTVESELKNTDRQDYPFSAADIARDGAGGIDQGRNPNCWFEASIAALAELPRGQRLLADTIRSRQNDYYVVRFHNDGVEYHVSRDDMTQHHINDKALWASIIECAQVKKFPDNAGAEGVDNDQSRLEVGLGCITGRKAEVIMPMTCEPEDLKSFIGSAIKSKNPIVAGTWGPAQLISLPPLVVPAHAYTVIDFDPAKNLVTVRNPHGKRSRKFSSNPDPKGTMFQQLDDGVIKLSLPLFQRYFHSVARSFI